MRLATLSSLLLLALAAPALAIDTAFTYQGTLEEAGVPANGAYDLRVDLLGSNGLPVAAANLFDDVPVVRGVFTVTLDYGAAALSGDPRALRVSIRPGASTGSFTILAPSTPITASPYAYVANEAFLAGGVVDGAIGSNAILDGSVGAVDLGANSVGTTEVADNSLTAADLAPSSVGASEIEPTQVQARVVQSCSSGSAIRQVFADGTVACQAPPAAADAWTLSGNAASSGQFLGTTNAEPLNLRAGGVAVASFEPGVAAPNVILGSVANGAFAGTSGATIGGGGRSTGGSSFNVVSDDFGTIAGGLGNSAGNGAGTIVDAAYATIAGGRSNTASGLESTVGGGTGNRALATQSAIAGGSANAAAGDQSAIGGGLQNSTGATYAAVPGGLNNCAGGKGSLAAGARAAIRAPDGAEVQGICTSYPRSGDADGDEGTFAWADAQLANFVSSGPNQFLVRAQGGVGINVAPPNETVELTMQSDADDGDFASLWLKQKSASGAGVLVSAGDATGANNAAFYVDNYNGASQPRRLALNADGSAFIRSNTTGANTGVTMAANGGSWSSLSDRRVKTAIVAVDPVDVLERVVAMPVSTWSYIAQGEGVRHMGPMAQDFAAAFGLGEDETHIATVDADGVALAAVQGLDAKLSAQRDALVAENAALRAQLAALAARVAAIEAARRGNMAP